jgi:hypothetical protein
MNTTNAVVLTGVLVVGGKWAQGTNLNIRIAIGIWALSLFLAVMNESEPELASKFAILVVLGALFLYGPAIVKKIGLTK